MYPICFVALYGHIVTTLRNFVDRHAGKKEAPIRLASSRGPSVPYGGLLGSAYPASLLVAWDSLFPQAQDGICKVLGLEGGVIRSGSSTERHDKTKLHVGLAGRDAVYAFLSSCYGVQADASAMKPQKPPPVLQQLLRHAPSLLLLHVSVMLLSGIPARSFALQHSGGSLISLPYCFLKSFKPATGAAPASGTAGNSLCSSTSPSGTPSSFMLPWRRLPRQQRKRGGTLALWAREGSCAPRRTSDHGRGSDSTFSKEVFPCSNTTPAVGGSGQRPQKQATRSKAGAVSDRKGRTNIGAAQEGPIASLTKQRTARLPKTQQDDPAVRCPFLYRISHVFFILDIVTCNISSPERRNPPWPLASPQAPSFMFVGGSNARLPYISIAHLYLLLQAPLSGRPPRTLASQESHQRHPLTPLDRSQQAPPGLPQRLQPSQDPLAIRRKPRATREKQQQKAEPLAPQQERDATRKHNVLQERLDLVAWLRETQLPLEGKNCYGSLHCYLFWSALRVRITMQQYTLKTFHFVSAAK